jgi:hypothetical protein
MARNCGECLMDAVEVVELKADGICPRCGADYGADGFAAHPAFVRAARLSEPLRSHFPKSADEARTFEPIIRARALSSRVLVVANTRIECAWAAYVDAVPGFNHRHERAAVLETGAKVDEAVARVLFPEFADIPYAG